MSWTFIPGSLLRKDKPVKFEVGDKVRMPGVPIVVEVLEIKQCDHEECTIGDGEMFRFKDPSGLGDDWMHVDDFVKVDE